MANGVIELNGISYRHYEHPRYKFILVASYEVNIEMRRRLDHPWFSLSEAGRLWIRNGYAWDGATSAPDVPSIIRGSLVHDVLYQSMRERMLPQDHRQLADEILYRICLEDGMWIGFAKIVYTSVRAFGAYAARAK